MVHKSAALADENLPRRKERAMLAQAETKTKLPFAYRNGRPDKSDGSDTQVAKIKKDTRSSRINYIKIRRI